MSAPDQLKMQQQIMMEQQRRAASMNPILQNNKGPLTHYVNSYFETLSNFQVSHPKRKGQLTTQ